MRIKVFVIIYSISVWITSFIFAQNDIKYFRKFSIDRRFCQIELKYPVSNSFYNKMSCYQVKYDDINRIQKIDFLEQGKLAIDNFGFTMFTIEYLDSLEKRSYFDKHGNPTLNRDGIHSYTLKKNLNDHPILPLKMVKRLKNICEILIS